MSDATRTIAPARRGVDDALAWVAKQPADKTFETADETFGIAAARLLAAEVERLRGALPGVIECANRMGAECKLYAWMPCCLTRERMVKAGLLLQPEPVKQEDDGA